MSGSTVLSSEQRAAPVLADLRSRLASVYGHDGERAAQAFSLDAIRRGTATAARQLMTDPSHYGSLQEGSAPAARRVVADLIAMRAAFEPGMHPPDGMSVASLGDEMAVRTALRGQMERVLGRLYEYPRAALRALDEAAGGRGGYDRTRPLTDFAAVLAGADPRLEVRPGSRPADVAELAAVARALEALNDFARAPFLGRTGGKGTTEARKASGEKLTEALGVVYGADAGKAERALVALVGDRGLFGAIDRFEQDPGSLGSVAADPEDRDRFSPVVRERLLEFVHALEQEAAETGANVSLNRPFSATEHGLASAEAARLEARMSARAKEIFRDPEAAREGVDRLMMQGPTAVRAAVWAAAQGKEDPFGAPGLFRRVADAAEYARDAGALAHTRVLIRQMERGFEASGGFPKDVTPSPPSPAAEKKPATPAGAAEIVGVPNPPAREEMDSFRRTLDAGAYDASWLPDTIRSRVVGIQVGLRNVSISLGGDATLVDAGPMGLSLKGRVDADSIADLLRAVAAKGMTAVKLSGSDAFKDRACVELSLMRPPIAVTNHATSAATAEAIGRLVAHRGPLEGPRADRDGPAMAR